MSAMNQQVRAPRKLMGGEGGRLSHPQPDLVCARRRLSVGKKQTHSRLLSIHTHTSAWATKPHVINRCQIETLILAQRAHAAPAPSFVPLCSLLLLLLMRVNQRSARHHAILISPGVTSKEKIQISAHRQHTPH